jgi:hypothetical protein
MTSAKLTIASVSVSLISTALTSITPVSSISVMTVLFSYSSVYFFSSTTSTTFLFLTARYFLTIFIGLSSPISSPLFLAILIYLIALFKFFLAALTCFASDMQKA